jgi:hypothetical protein
MFPLRIILLAPAAALAALALGCANPAQPKPPSLRLPEKAGKPTATRLGDQIVFTWTTPPKTTDGDPIQGPITAVICRESAPTPAHPNPNPPCTPVLRTPTTTGPATATESLPAALLTGPHTLLTYRIDLVNANGRSAGPSIPVYAAAGAAPPPTAALAIRARRDGAALTWPRTASDAPMHLTRTLLNPPPAPPKPAAKSGPNFGTPKTEPILVHLAPEPPLPATDPGGIVDHSPIDGGSYTYSAQRVLALTLAGHPVELFGLPATATFTFHDIFPPAAPTGLVSIPGGGFGAAPSIDLSWDPNPERDILGYNIYRASDGITFTRLNPAILPTAAYRDLTAEPGRPYLYAVTAIDQHHNESDKSAQIHETLRR